MDFQLMLSFVLWVVVTLAYADNDKHMVEMPEKAIPLAYGNISFFWRNFPPNSVFFQMSYSGKMRYLSNCLY